MTGGPKNYAYRVLVTEDGREKTVCKVNYKALKMANFDVIRDMILGDEPPIVNVHAEHKNKSKRKGAEQ